MAIGLDDYIPKDQDDVSILSFPLFVLNLLSQYYFNLFVRFVLFCFVLLVKTSMEELLRTKSSECKQQV